MKNAFHGLINVPDMAEERISELEEISIETSRTQKQREQKTERTRITKGCGTSTKV